MSTNTQRTSLGWLALQGKKESKMTLKMCSCRGRMTPFLKWELITIFNSQIQMSSWRADPLNPSSIFDQSAPSRQPTPTALRIINESRQISLLRLKISRNTTRRRTSSSKSSKVISSKWKTRSKTTWSIPLQEAVTLSCRLKISTLDNSLNKAPTTTNIDTSFTKTSLVQEAMSRCNILSLRQTRYHLISKSKLILELQIFPTRLCRRGTWAHLTRIKTLGLLYHRQSKCQSMGKIRSFQWRFWTNREILCRVNHNINSKFTPRGANQPPRSSLKTGMMVPTRCLLWTFKKSSQARISDSLHRKVQDIRKATTLCNLIGQIHQIAALLSILLISFAGETIEQPWWYAIFQINTRLICYWNQLIVTSLTIMTFSTTLSTRTIGVDSATPSSTSSTQFTLLSSISNITERDGTDSTARKFVVLNMPRIKVSKHPLKKWSTWKTIKGSRSSRWSCLRCCHQTLKLSRFKTSCINNLVTLLDNLTEFYPILKIHEACRPRSVRYNEWWSFDAGNPSV